MKAINYVYSSISKVVLTDCPRYGYHESCASCYCDCEFCILRFKLESVVPTEEVLCVDCSLPGNTEAPCQKCLEPVKECLNRMNTCPKCKKSGERITECANCICHSRNTCVCSKKLKAKCGDTMTQLRNNEASLPKWT
jgi:hypothetical protein